MQFNINAPPPPNICAIFTSAESTHLVASWWILLLGRYLIAYFPPEGLYLPAFKLPRVYSPDSLPGQKEGRISACFALISANSSLCVNFLSEHLNGHVIMWSWPCRKTLPCFFKSCHLWKLTANKLSQPSMVTGERSSFPQWQYIVSENAEKMQYPFLKNIYILL